MSNELKPCPACGGSKLLENTRYGTIVCKNEECSGLHAQKSVWQSLPRREDSAELVEALQAVNPMLIPGMDWTDETGEEIKKMVRSALEKWGK